MIKTAKPSCLTVFFKSANERTYCEKRLKSAFGGIFITSSLQNNLEICPPGTSKGAALIWLCKKLRTDISNVAVAGDSKNDITAFKNKRKKIRRSKRL